MIVLNLKLTASFWRNLWRDNSSPLTGHIHDIMKETRMKYHYHDYGIRNIKSKEEDILKKHYFSKLRVITLEVKRIKNKSTLSSQSIEIIYK